MDKLINNIENNLALDINPTSVPEDNNLVANLELELGLIDASGSVVASCKEEHNIDLSGIGKYGEHPEGIETLGELQVSREKLENNEIGISDLVLVDKLNSPNYERSQLSTDLPRTENVIEASNVQEGLGISRRNDIKNKANRNDKEDGLKLGNNSVTLTGVTDTTAALLPSLPDKLDNFYNLLQSFIKTPQDSVNWDGRSGGYKIKSKVALSESGGVVSTPKNMAAHVAVSLPAACKVDTVFLRFTAPLKTNMIPEEDLIAFAPNGVLNTKAFENIFIAPLTAAEPARRQVIIALSDYWNSNRMQGENSTIYAKLIYYAMLRQRFADEGINPVIAENQVGGQPTYINISSLEQFTVANLTKPIINRETTFVREYGYVPENYRFYRLITFNGPYFLHPKGARIIPSAFYHIPGIPITIIARGPLESSDNVDLSSREIWDFAYRMAAARGEWVSLKKGMAMASDIALNDAIPNDIRSERSSRTYRITNPFMELGDPGWPQPTDYCWFYRLANIVKSNNEIFDAELKAAQLLSSYEMNLLTVLRNTMIHIMCVSIFYNLNITGREIQQYLQDSPQSSAIIRPLWASSLFQVPKITDEISGYLKSASFYKLVFDNVQTCSGWVLYSEYMNGRSWNSPRYYAAELSTDTEYFASVCPRNTYRKYNLLCVDQWLLQRPSVWGISLPGPYCNFSKELVDRGAPEAKGYYTELGSDQITNSPGSKQPHLLLNYVPAAINSITQGLRGHLDKYVLKRSICQWNTSGRSHWTWINAIDPPIQYNPELYIFELCSIMTFNWSDETIYAPVFTQDDNPHIITYLQNISGSEWHQVGLTRELTAPRVETTTSIDYTLPCMGYPMGRLPPSKEVDAARSDFTKAAPE